MNLERIKFDIRRLFKPSEGKQYFILEATGIESLVIPESKIRELPYGLKRKFFMQQAISFQIIMPALNDWIKENNEKAKNTKSSRKIINPEMANQKSGSPS